MSTAPTPPPTSLTTEGDALVITWSDGVRHTLRWKTLRENCPCATCRAKREQPPEPPSLLPVIRPEEAQPVKAVRMEPLGHYAYAIHFSDGHNTGIYSLEFLRRLGEAES